MSQTHMAWITVFHVLAGSLSVAFKGVVFVCYVLSIPLTVP